MERVQRLNVGHGDASYTAAGRIDLPASLVKPTSVAHPEDIRERGWIRSPGNG